MKTLALLIALVAALPFGLQGDDVPSRKQQQELVDEYFEVDAWSAEGRARRAEIVKALASVPPLKRGDVKSWTKRIEKAWKDLPTLEKSSGQAYLFPDAEPDQARGLYIVGGDTGKPKGLLIAMHGGGVGSGDAAPMAAGYNSPASKRDLLMIAPEVLEKTERGWTDSGTEEFVMQLVERALRTWKIDPDRVYFSGHSMGGYGSWTLGAHHADRLAAAAPSAGGPTPIMDINGEFYDIVEGIVPNLRNLRVCCYQSADDAQVPPGPNRIATKKIEQAQERWGGFDYEYWEVDGRGHGAPPGGYDALLDKVIEARRNTRPERIVWQPTLSWKQDFYWLRWESPEKFTTLVVDLDKAKNEVRIEADGVALHGFSLYFDEDMLDLDEEVVVIVEDEEVFRGVLEPTLDALLSSAGRGDPGYLFTHRVHLD
ncbi:MAG: hypothetical protein P1V81_18180 [Planctomycetota bacterium]|nr:hypothetical protein [Planctomycetota bacterium]